MLKKILIVGPSPDRSKGGMATVIDEIRNDEKLAKDFSIDIYESYIDGKFITRLFFSVISYLKFILFQNKYDIYHIHAASRGSTFRKGYYVKTIKRWGKKVIFHIHGAEYMVFYNDLSRKKQEKVLEILNSADMVIALSLEWKKTFDASFGLNNCVVLQNGINMNRLKTAITDPSKNQKSFVCLGQIGKRKGSYDLIKAIKVAKEKVPDIKLFLAGDGELNKVKELIKLENLERNVEVVGWLDFDKKIEILKRVSTVTLPSYNEGLPMSILEGMACGKAIISTTVGAIPEVVKKENGILIKPGEVQQLSDALIKCSSNLEMITEMHKSNITKITSSYSMDVMHQQLAKYYLEL